MSNDTTIDQTLINSVRGLMMFKNDGQQIAQDEVFRRALEFYLDNHKVECSAESSNKILVREIDRATRRPDHRFDEQDSVLGPMAGHRDLNIDPNGRGGLGDD